MFTVADGPMALQAELVRALSLSLNATKLDGSDLEGRFCAALAAVWNGKKGTVALLLRNLDKPILRRHVFSGPLTSAKAVASAVDEGIAFAESMGFKMDQPDFAELDEPEQTERLGCWNDLRRAKNKVSHIKIARTGAGARGKAAAKPAAASEPESAAEPGKAVLGRLALVRQDTSGLAGPLARLLSYF